MKNINAVIQILSQCQNIYDENLKNNKVMFVYERANRTLGKEEMFFGKKNFYHLTGLVAYDKNGYELSANVFYDLLSMNRLNEVNIERKNNMTDMKLQILPQLMRIDRMANIIGDYAETGLYLQTDRIAGNVNACMGFVKDDKLKLYIPNTTLKEDIRKITVNNNKIVAIFKKNITNNLYQNVTYLKKQYEIEDILKSEEIKKYIDTDNMFSADRITEEKIFEYYYRVNEDKDNKERTEMINEGEMDIEELRRGYRIITGLDNDDELSDEEIRKYMKDTIEKDNDDMDYDY